MKATSKQVSFALSLLQENGYSTTYMNSRFSQLGVTMRQRSGTVESWLRNMQVHEISALITKLKS